MNLSRLNIETGDTVEVKTVDESKIRGMKSMKKRDVEAFLLTMKSAEDFLFLDKLFDSLPYSLVDNYNTLDIVSSLLHTSLDEDVVGVKTLTKQSSYNPLVDFIYLKEENKYIYKVKQNILGRNFDAYRGLSVEIVIPPFDGELRLEGHLISTSKHIFKDKVINFKKVDVSRDNTFDTDTPRDNTFGDNFSKGQTVYEAKVEHDHWYITMFPFSECNYACLEIKDVIIETDKPITGPIHIFSKFQGAILFGDMRRLMMNVLTNKFRIFKSEEYWELILRDGDERRRKVVTKLID